MCVWGGGGGCIMAHCKVLSHLINHNLNPTPGPTQLVLTLTLTVTEIGLSFPSGVWVQLL